MSRAATLYVYYRVQAADAPALIAAVRELQALWQAALPGLTCTLSQRADNPAGSLTLMETYSHAAGLAPQWQQQIEQVSRERLAGWILGARQVEVFVACA